MKVMGGNRFEYKSGVVDKLGNSTKINFQSGFRHCPVFCELRNVREGIALGDLKQAALNSGLLALYVVPVGGASNGSKTL